MNILPHILFFFLSGAGTLILETVWLKEHLITFGNSPGAYGSVLFVYFVGVGLGSYVFGRDNAPRLPFWALSTAFGASIVFSYLLPVLVFDTSAGLQLSIFQSPHLYTMFKWGIAVAALAPACFFLGAFFPLVGRTVAPGMFVLLYGVQTIGALAGICLGSFALPYVAGYRLTFVAGLVINLLSLAAYRAIPQPRDDVRAVSGTRNGPVLPGANAARHAVIAFGGGLVISVLQVLWIRFVTIGTDNSIYAFGAVSLVILALVSAASVIVPALPAPWFRSHHALHAVFGLSLGGILLSTFLFVKETGGLSVVMIGSTSGFRKSLGFALPFAAVGYLAPCFIFPLLLRQDLCACRENSGRRIGVLIALNSAGCAAGSLLGAFVLLPRAGIWATALFAMAVYALLPLALDNLKVRLPAVLIAALLVALLNPLSYPLVTPVNPFDDHGGSGTIVSVSQGRYGIVSVIDYPGQTRTLWLNNSYLLEAGMGNVQGARRMGILPTLLKPDARDLAMIGIGTGITASGFLSSRLKNMTLIELIPEVRKDATTFFKQYNLDVLHDPRVKARIADGRQYFKTTPKRYDIIVSDLFTPWNEGTSYLYTREHFGVIRRHLRPGGIFCLWLPMYQLTEQEFRIIAKTFSSVFPRTTLWQLEISIDAPVLALIGGDAAFNPDTVAAEVLKVPGRVTGRRPDIIEVHPSGILGRYVCPVDPGSWAGVPLNTLDRPVLEFVTAQKERNLLVGRRYVDFMERNYALPANPDNRYFSRYSDTLEGFRQSGLYLNQYQDALADHDAARSHDLLSRAKALTPAIEMAERGN